MFLPTTREEMKALRWNKLDIILVNGDAYIDSPFMGVAVIGKVLLDAGYKVGVISQPDCDSDVDITRLGQPRLFWGITGGGVDSMVANHTALKKRRRSDDYTPGGLNNKRPDRAVIVYCNLIRKYFKNTAPLVLGGVEASLRRVSHYDYWSNKIRRSILFDAKADILVYGMGENSTLAVAAALNDGVEFKDIRGICYAAKEKPDGCLELPAHDLCVKSHDQFTDMFKVFYANNEPQNAKPLCQLQDSRWLVQNRPAEYLTRQELDRVHGLDFERTAHPYHALEGEVRALDTIRFSLPAVRGCYGECSFCSIAVHQGRTVRWRSEKSLVNEAELVAKLPDFKGYILDVGGPTANMYGYECPKKLAKGPCANKRCVYPDVCQTMKPNHGPLLSLMSKLRGISGVKKSFIASGIRHDLVLEDRKNGQKFIDILARHHVSGQLKLAPEHSENNVLQHMGKPDTAGLLEFRKRFMAASKAAHKDQYLTYYMIAAHPGCTQNDMQKAKKFATGELQLNPEQVQIFTPLPSSWSAVMYHTGKDPFTGKPIFVEKDPQKKQAQKDALVDKELHFRSNNRPQQNVQRRQAKPTGRPAGKSNRSPARVAESPKATSRKQNLRHKKKK